MVLWDGLGEEVKGDDFFENALVIFINMMYNKTNIFQEKIMKIENGKLIEFSESDLQRVELKQSFLDRLARRHKYAYIANIPEEVKEISAGAFAKEALLKMTDVNLPGGLEEIGDNAFENAICLKSVQLPESVTKLGKSAFSGCYMLEKASFGSAIEEVPEGCFKDCKNLYSVNLPGAVKSVGDFAFSGCENLKNFPELQGLVKVGNRAFRDCVNLSGIYLPEGLTTIGADAFENCRSISQVKLPETLTEMGDGAFCDTGLKSVVIPRGLKSVEMDAFSGCLKLSDVVLPEGIESIESGAFSMCSNLKKINLPQSLTLIGDKAFATSGLSGALSIPAGVKEIQNGAFSNCKKLSGASLSEGLEVIGDEAFSGCVSLAEPALPSSLKHLGKGAYKGCHFSQISLPAQIKSLSPYVFADCKNLRNVLFSDNLQSVGAYAFRGTSIRECNLPRTITSVGDGAYSDCKRLEVASFPNTLENLGNGIFKGCTSLYEFAMPTAATRVPNSMFEGCERLSGVKVSDSVKEIGDKAFDGCKQLTDFRFPAHLTKIGERSFHSCMGLTEPELGNEITDIGRGAFANCGNITYVKLPPKIKDIWDEVFSNCGSLEKVVVPDGVETIGHNAFESCMELKSINFPDTITEIGKDAFNACASLKSVKLPSSLVTIGEGAFDSCFGLTKMDFPEGLKNIGDYAFNNCSNLGAVSLPDSIENVGMCAFTNCYEIDKYSLPSKRLNFGEVGNMNLFYYTDLGDRVALTTEPMPDQKSIPIQVNLQTLSEFWNDRKVLLKEQGNVIVREFYDRFLSQVLKTVSEKFVTSHNFTFFKKFEIEPENYPLNFYVFKALFNLGAMDTPFEDNGKRYDYSQKISNFLQDRLSKGEIRLEDFEPIFENMEIEGFKKEFSDFFMENFDRLLKIEAKNPGFISRCYNEFESVQKTNTSNRGSQRQLKATVDKFVQYFSENGYENVTEETQEIASTIKHYFPSQKAFDDASRIDKERRQNHVPDHILSVALKEEDVFAGIDDYAKKIHALRLETFEDLSQVATKQFTFEWLAKNDPKNFILGKFCSCCSHLEAAGYGIMHASIVCPNVQSLVVKDENGEIVAKSTLYVNPEQGYGVFNNAEVSHKVPMKKYSKIYQKLILGIEAFAEEYNREHPDAPLRQINIGMKNNDLQSDIIRTRQRSKTILAAPAYGKYGTDKFKYDGDSSESQYIIWKSGDRENDKQRI